MTPAMPQVEEGSTGLGFLAGFFGGILGLVLVLILAKGRKTKKGAIFGIVGQFVLGFVGGILVFVILGTRAAPGVSSPPTAVTVTRPAAR